jgi:hypothetical protein
LLLHLVALFLFRVALCLQQITSCPFRLVDEINQVCSHIAIFYAFVFFCFFSRCVCNKSSTFSLTRVYFLFFSTHVVA